MTNSTRIERIYTDQIGADLQYPRHPRAIKSGQKKLVVMIYDNQFKKL